MCGICCVVQPHSVGHDRSESRDRLAAELNAGLEYIKHRGPDAQGVWVSSDGQVGVAHCRLAINDLREFASQPLHSPDGIVHAVVNGEIYDVDRLRQTLHSEYAFRTRSDSELVVALYLAHGMPGCLEYLRGEFAFCLYDERTRVFYAVRDRYGIKPLFWTMFNGRLLVAAEMKAFLGMGWTAEWDVLSLLEGGWNFDDRTIFAGVKKVSPGHYLSYGLDDQKLTFRKYWDTEYANKNKIELRSEEELIAGAREKMIDAVRLRLQADVPVGIYLSGGIDSSALAGIATHLVRTEGLSMGSQDPTRRIKCFSIAFEESSGFDESKVAERTAAWLGVKHVKKLMNEVELARNFEAATWHCEQQNHGDLSFIGKFALSEVVRQHGYKVVLTGEGADEHFAGYPMYLPDFLRVKDVAWPMSELSEDERRQRCSSADEEIDKYYTSIGAHRRTCDEATKQLGGISTPSAMCGFYFDCFSSWTKSLRPANPQITISRSIDEGSRQKIMNIWHPLHSALYTWSKGHLVNNFLSCLGDRTEMAHSVEARPPFLDHHLTSYVNFLPPSLKIKYNGTTGEFVEKWIQRQAAEPFITRELFERKKHPYSAPTSYPEGGPIHKLLSKLLTRENILNLGFVDWELCKGLLSRAFGAGDAKAMRNCFVIGQWIVLADRFDVKTATLDDCLTNHDMNDRMVSIQSTRGCINMC